MQLKHTIRAKCEKATFSYTVLQAAYVNLMPPRITDKPMVQLRLQHKPTLVDFGLQPYSACSPSLSYTANQKKCNWTLTKLLSAEQWWGTNIGASGLRTDCARKIEPSGATLPTVPPVEFIQGVVGDGDMAGCGSKLGCCRFARTGLPMDKAGEVGLNSGESCETWTGSGSGSDADVIRGTPPLIGAKPAGIRLLEYWGDGIDGLIAADVGKYGGSVAGFRCSDSVGVECDGAGGDSENGCGSGYAASVGFCVRPGGFSARGDGLVATDWLHCSDTQWTWPGGLECRLDDGDGEPQLNLSRPRPRLCPPEAEMQ